MGMNMLSAKKVRLHGLQDTRWTAKDHKTQLKGIVKLFEMDKKIAACSLGMSSKKMTAEMKKWQKLIDKTQFELTVASRHGNRSEIRNIMSEDRQLKLAYQNLPPDQIFEHLEQAKYQKRRMLDQMSCKLRLKMEELILLKLAFGDAAESKRLCEAKTEDVTVRMKQYSGYLQDMILKRDAAIVVRTTYRSILDILQRDAIYYNVVLETLQIDAKGQCKILIQTAMLGQLGTEILDDKRCQYEALHIKVKAEEYERKQTLEDMRERVLRTLRNLRSLIRKDSDCTMCFQRLSLKASASELTDQIELLTKQLKYLQDSTQVSHFNSIFPCFYDQQEHSFKLRMLKAKCQENLLQLRKVRNHAELQLMKMKNLMIEGTGGYKELKANLMQEILEYQKKTLEFKRLKQNKGKSLHCIKKGLNALRTLTTKIFDKNVPPDDEPWNLTGLTAELIEPIKKRVTILLQIESDPPSPPLLEAQSQYGLMVDRQYKRMTVLRFTQLLALTIEPVAEVEEDYHADDLNVPTRETIKASAMNLVSQRIALEEYD